MPEVIDVSASFPGCVKAERKGVNTLVLWKLDCPFRRADGKMAGYQVTYFWHKTADSDIHSVQGDDYTYWMRKEIKEILAGKGLFECLQVF